MKTNHIDPTQLNNRLLKIILALGIITFITSIIGLVKYSILSYWFQTGLIYGISLSDSNYALINFSTNVSQRVPFLFIWILLAYGFVDLYRKEDKMFKVPSILAAIIVGVLSLSILLLISEELSLYEFSYRMLLGQLEPDFFIQLLANVGELLIWLRLRSYMEISPYLKKNQKKRVLTGFIIMIIAASSSLLLRGIFVSNELALGFTLANFYPYYTRIFGILTVVEVVKAFLYLVGGLVVGGYKEKRVKPDKNYLGTEL
ncbi:MAG: hypothetical protein EU530_08695 [Promethearchaeota archaeon]|nr:MAG: hypothetical protein EU530_08695 [Candidatus Lokiarchaeota archaeon]